MTKKELLALPPVQIHEPGSFIGLCYLGAGNVYANQAGTLISTGIFKDGMFDTDLEGDSWVQVEDGLGPNGELL